MPDQLSLSGADFLAHQRVGDLRSTAHELHGVPKPQGTHLQAGRIERVRTALGRRLVSLGGALPGHHG
jgi:hypothetical protein